MDLLRSRVLGNSSTEIPKGPLLRPFFSFYFLLPTLRRVTMKTLGYFLGRRDFWPLPVGLSPR